jgi:monoamine oxidase
MHDIVIIGAGAAGIAAARTLRDRYIDFRLIEAKDHVGGRAHTDSVSLATPVDLGCYWFHSPQRNPLVSFADRLGHRYRAGTQNGRYARGAHLLDLTESQACAEYLCEGFNAIRKHASVHGDVSPVELLPSGGAWDRYLAAALVAKMGVALEDISIQDFAEYVWEGEDLPVLDGLGNLVAKLAFNIPVALQTPAQRIDWSRRDKIKVTTPRGTLEARAVIVTLSVGALAGDAIVFDPPLPDWKRAAIHGLTMGSCNKVVLAFDENIFGDCRDALLVSDRGASESVEIVLRPDGKNLIHCLFNGPLSRSIARDGAAVMRAYVLDMLAEIFGGDLRGHVLDATITADWDADPWVRGCFSAVKRGQSSARLDLGRPVENRLFFAGEATSREFAGDVHGAYLSGVAASEAACPLDASR